MPVFAVADNNEFEMFVVPREMPPKLELLLLLFSDDELVNESGGVSGEFQPLWWW